MKLNTQQQFTATDDRRRGAMALEAKLGMFVITILVFAFGFIVYRKVDMQQRLASASINPQASAEQQADPAAALISELGEFTTAAALDAEQNQNPFAATDASLTMTQPAANRDRGSDDTMSDTAFGDPLAALAEPTQPAESAAPQTAAADWQTPSDVEPFADLFPQEPPADSAVAANNAPAAGGSSEGELPDLDVAQSTAQDNAFAAPELDSADAFAAKTDVQAFASPTAVVHDPPAAAWSGTNTDRNNSSPISDPDPEPTMALSSNESTPQPLPTLTEPIPAIADTAESIALPEFAFDAAEPEPPQPEASTALGSPVVDFNDQAPTVTDSQPDFTFPEEPTTGTVSATNIARSGNAAARQAAEQFSNAAPAANEPTADISFNDLRIPQEDDHNEPVLLAMNSPRPGTAQEQTTDWPAFGDTSLGGQSPPAPEKNATTPTSTPGFDQPNSSATDSIATDPFPVVATEPAAGQPGLSAAPATDPASTVSWPTETQTASRTIARHSVEPGSKFSVTAYQYLHDTPSPTNSNETWDVTTVGPGENYWSISKRVYGTSRFFSALALFNQHRIPDPKKMRTGMKVLIPPGEKLESMYPQLFENQRPRRVLPAAFLTLDDGAPAYRVGRAETLSEISQRFLGRSSRWIEIYRLNSDVLQDPNKLKPGSILRLPADAVEVHVIP